MAAPSAVPATAERALARVRPVAVVAALTIVLAAGLVIEMPWWCPLGQCPAIARVGALTYSIGSGQELLVEPDDVDAYGQISRIGPHGGDGGLADMTTYRLRGLDPELVLLARWDPEFVAVQEYPIGDWAVLMRGDYAELCPYIDPDAESYRFYCLEPEVE
jgi:hypothetical protein